MLPVDFPQKNFTFTKPADMTNEECGSLDVWKGDDAAGTPLIYSFWQFNKEELDAIKAGEITGVWLGIVGRGMPPVSLQTENPFAQP